MTAEKATLEEVFTTVGKRYGYDQVTAEFTPFKDFKVRWSRSYRCIDFQISDYLMDATPAVIEGLADSLYSKIACGEPKDYSKKMVEWVTSKEFVENKQPVYLRRSSRITKSKEGKFRDLGDSLRRLKLLGLVEDDMDPFLSWTRDPLHTTTGYCSTLMNVIVISSAFDSQFIPDEVVDYAVYHECLMIREGKATFGLGSYFDITTEMEKFPKADDAENWIKKMCLHI